MGCTGSIVIVLSLSQLLLARAVEKSYLSHSSTEDVVFVSGTAPLDDTGDQVEVHEGWILQIEDTYLWYGTDRKVNSSSPSGHWDWVSGAVNLYTSHDLSTWRKKGTVFKANTIPAAAKQHLATAGPYRIERPKVLYNSVRRYYVLIFHLDTLDSDLNEVGWATSASPYGPFVFQQSTKPDGLGSLDLTVAAVADLNEGSSSEAYLVRTTSDGVISISRLDTDYLSTTGVCSSIPAQTSTITMAGRHRAPAAPSLFRYRERWYLLANEGKDRWLPSAPILFVSNGTDLCGASWSKLQPPAAGPGARTAFDSTPAFVMPYTFSETSEVLLIYYGDRWNADGPGSVANASYVWLPLVPDADGHEPLQLHLVNPVGGKWSIKDYRPVQIAVT